MGLPVSLSDLFTMANTPSAALLPVDSAVQQQQLQQQLQQQFLASSPAAAVLLPPQLQAVSSHAPQHEAATPPAPAAPPAADLAAARRRSGGGAHSDVVALASFAALLSSAQTNSLAHPLLSSGEPALAEFLSSSTDAGSGLEGRNNAVNRQQQPPCCSFPSLLLRNPNGSPASGSVTLKDAAAINLAAPLRVARCDVEKVPVTLLKNCSAGFLKLVDSRLRSTVAALLQHQKLAAVGGCETTAIVVKLLSRRDPVIKVTTIVTSFRVLGQGQGGNSSNQDEDVAQSETTLPLVFEVVIDALALGKLVTVTLQAPGTITGSRSSSDGLLCRVEVNFDTLALLRSMMDQARIVVKKAVEQAAAVAAKAARERKEALKREQREEEERAQEMVSQRQQQQQWGRSSAPSSLNCSITSFGSLANALARHSSQQLFGNASGMENQWQGSANENHNATSNTHDPYGADAFPQHLRNTMAQLARESTPADIPPTPPPRPQSLDFLTVGSCRSDDLIEGHSQPLTLAVLYEREDREKREAEEHAARIRAIAAAVSSSNDSGGGSTSSDGGGDKIELFSWLKGDSMLLSEEEDERAMHTAASASAQAQAQVQVEQAEPQVHPQHTQAEEKRQQQQQQSPATTDAAAHLQAIQAADLLLKQQSLHFQQQQQASISLVASLPNQAGSSAATAETPLGLPVAYAAGRLPHSFSSLSASDMLTETSSTSLAQQDEGRRSSLPSCLSLSSKRNDSSFGQLLKSGGSRKRVSFSSLLDSSGSGSTRRNESFGSQGSASSEGSTPKKMKKQVSFKGGGSIRRSRGSGGSSASSTSSGRRPNASFAV